MSNYTGNGQYQLDSLAIESGTGTVVDLRASLVDMVVYESMYDSVMSASVTIIDSDDLVSRLPIYGNEKFHVKWHTLGSEENAIEQIFYVYKISTRNRVTEHSEGYTLHLTSALTMYSERSFVNRYMQDNGHKIVNNIYNQFIPAEERKTVSFTPTSSTNTYTFGNQSPLECINMVSKYSSSKDGSVGYTFFETPKTVVFSPLQELYKKEPVTEYIYRNRGVYEDVTQKDVEIFNSIQDVRFLEDGSFMDRIRDGQHGSTFSNLNIISKTYSSYNYSKDNEFNTEKSIATSSGLADLTNPKYEDIQIHSQKVITPKQFDMSVKNRMQMKESENIRADIVVFGDSSIHVGETCVATLPSYNSNHVTDKNRISGKFLISEIKHLFNAKTYRQVIRLEKDGYED